jgi:hypothetical protein
VEGDCVHFRPYDDSDAIPVEAMADGWKIREAFLGIRDAKGIYTFLDEFGRFQQQARNGHLSLDTVQRWQRVIRWLLTHPMPEWGWFTGSASVAQHGRYGPLMHFGQDIYYCTAAANNFNVSFRMSGSVSMLRVLAPDVITAMLASVYVDAWQGLRYGICGRQDCLTPFLIKTKRERSYCTNYCAHLEGMRRTRAEAKELKRKSQERRAVAQKNRRRV